MQATNDIVTCGDCGWIVIDSGLKCQPSPDAERTDFLCPECGLKLATKKLGFSATFIASNVVVQ